MTHYSKISWKEEIETVIRITGGTFRSRLLETPLTDKTKPTMDRVREGIFNALGNKVNNAKVLDLFAGSGSYGFESLSRGAKSVVFIDITKESSNAIKLNAQKLKVSSFKYIHQDVVSFLKETDESFDIIFADPPYALKVYEDIIEIVSSKNLLNDGGCLVLETEKELSIPENTFKEVRFYKYGIAKIYLLKR